MSRSYTSQVVQDVWEVSLEILRLVSLEVRDERHRFSHLEPDVDRAWEIWRKAAEEGLLSACWAAVGPCPQGDLPFKRTGEVVVQTWAGWGSDPW